MAVRNGKTVRGTTNRNERGSASARRSRKHYLLVTYQSDEGEGTCRCYRCGDLLDYFLLTVDRIKPGCQGGTYHRPNIRPACSGCNSETGGALSSPKIKKTNQRRLKEAA